MPTCEEASAKINLALHVTDRRGDGYHLLDSLVVFTELGDRLSLDEAGDGPALALSGPFGNSLSAGADNLVLKAVDAFSQASGIDCSAQRFALEKRLPVASGIGGGSADAAAALRLLNQSCNRPLSDEALADIGLALGADIPVCLRSQACRMAGVGDIIEPVNLPVLHLVLVNPGREVSTADVFKALDGTFGTPMEPITDLIRTDFIGFLARQRNDLEQPAMSLCPDIVSAKIALEQIETCRLARMSGSGATMVGLFDDAEAAGDAARRLGRAYPDWWIEATRTLV